MGFLDTVKSVPGGISAISKMKKMQKELARERVVVEENGVKVIVGGDQMIKELEIDGVMSKKVVEAVNKALKKTLELSAKKMQEMSGMDPMSLLKGLS